MMTSLQILQNQLKALSTNIIEINPLINRLRNVHEEVHGETRLELAAEINALLKEAEDEAELVRGDVEALEELTAAEHSRRRSKIGGVSEEKERESERVVALAGRLEDDLNRFVVFPVGMYGSFC